MNKELTQEAIKVMQAYVAGEEIEVFDSVEGEWVRLYFPFPSWDWRNRSYRIAPQKPSINWDHVDEKYIALAVDEDGVGYLYTERPENLNTMWDGDGLIEVKTFSSYKRGNVPWSDSLVMRPGHEDF